MKIAATYLAILLHIPPTWNKKTVTASPAATVLLLKKESGPLLTRLVSSAISFFDQQCN
jgi:hypothetical protein